MSLKPQNGNITLAKAKILGNPEIVPQHIVLQQLVGNIFEEPKLRNRHCIASFRTQDIERAFGPGMKAFYLSGKNSLIYVALKSFRADEHETFGTVVALPMEQTEAVFENAGAEALANLMSNSGEAPYIRVTLLMTDEEAKTSPIAEEFEPLAYEEFDGLVMMKKLNQETIQWDDNNDPFQETKPKVQVQLRDIPMDTRANRILLRDALAKNHEVLNGLYEAYLEQNKAQYPDHIQLNFDGWMHDIQGVDVFALEKMRYLDELPDDQYVDAMVTFKQAEVKAYHNKAVEQERTTLPLHEWCYQHFGEDYLNIGRAAALAEIHGTYVTEDVEQPDEEDLEAAVFVVTFDGTIVENQAPQIGPESPFAIEVLKALKRDGNFVIILTDRGPTEIDEMMAYLKASDFVPHGVIDHINANELIQIADIKYNDPAMNGDAGALSISYFIDHKFYGANTIQISGKKDAPPTLYWGDLAYQLHNGGYLNDDDLEKIAAALPGDSE